VRWRQILGEFVGRERPIEPANRRRQGQPSAPRQCVVSLATADKSYPEYLDRLERSLEHVGFAGEFMCWRPGSFPVDSPAHMEVPFAFKPYCLSEAREHGGKLLLWVDSSCVAVRPLEPIFDQIERDGYILFRNDSHRVGEWASDEALGALGLSRDEAMEMPEVNAAVIGLNMSSPVSNLFLERWRRTAQEGLAFRGVSDQLRDRKDYQAVKSNRGARVSSDPRVRGHRHDQTVAGVLAARLGMRLSSAGLWVSSGARRTKPIDPKARIVLVRIPSKVREYVFDHDGGRCRRCGATQDLALDHIIPLSRGGLNTEENLQVLCAPCIRSKGNRSVEHHQDEQRSV
jgi:HNH endonuclease